MPETPFDAGARCAAYDLLSGTVTTNPFNTGLGLEAHNAWQSGYDELKRREAGALGG